MRREKKEYSKVLLIQESVLIWIMSLGFLVLAFYCIHNQFLGTLPWLTAMVAFPWSAYGISQVYYYKKSMAENTKDGIKFQSVIKDLEKVASQYQDASALNYANIMGNVNNTAQVAPNYTINNTENIDDYII